MLNLLSCYLVCNDLHPYALILKFFKVKDITRKNNLGLSNGIGLN